MAGRTNAQGTRLYYAPDGTAWTEVLPAAAAGSPWVEITDCVSVEVVPFEAEDYDDSVLSDTAEVIETDHKAGNVTFTKDVNSQSITLDGFALAKSLHAFAVLYLNGTARYNESCRFTPTSGGSAQKGDFKAKAQESYRVKPVTGSFALQAADTP